jgi:putative ABC transport system permease protein
VACIGQGVEAELENKMRSLFEQSTALYDPFLAEADAEVIILGGALARSLNVETGDYVTLMATTAQGALNALDLKVAGTFTGSSPEYDARAMMIPLRTAQMLLDTNKVKHLLITLDDSKMTDMLYKEISLWAKNQGHPVTLRKWHEQALYYQKVKQFYSQMTGFMFMALFILVFFSTANTIVMAVLERTSEIGTLLSIGTSRRQTVKMFCAEGLFMGIIGGILSMAFAYGFSSLVNGWDIMLPPPPGLTGGYPLMMRNEWDFYLGIFLVTVVVATASSLFPALRTLRMKIVDALRHV